MYCFENKNKNPSTNQTLKRDVFVFVLFFIVFLAREGMSKFKWREEKKKVNRSGKKMTTIVEITYNMNMLE